MAYIRIHPTPSPSRSPRSARQRALARTSSAATRIKIHVIDSIQESRFCAESRMTSAGGQYPRIAPRGIYSLCVVLPIPLPTPRARQLMQFASCSPAFFLVSPYPFSRSAAGPGHRIARGRDRVVNW